MKTRKDSNALFSCDNCGKSMSPLEQSHLTNEPEGNQTRACKPTGAPETRKCSNWDYHHLGSKCGVCGLDETNFHKPSKPKAEGR